MKNIMIVEDEFIISYQLRLMLEELGYTVLIRSHNSEIINLIKQGQYDLILMDINYGDGCNGIEIVEEIRQFSSIPVIYFTGDSDRKVLERAERTNPILILSKPMNDNIIISKLQELKEHNDAYKTTTGT